MRDLIYLDAGKAASLLSQVEGGLLQEVRDSDEASVDSKAGLQANLHVLKADFGGSGAERTSRVETRILHHSLLTRLENALFAEGLALNLNREMEKAVVDVTSIRSVTERAPYLLSEGWAVIEDYERLKRRVEHFNPLIDMIARSARAELEKSEVYQSTKQQIAEQRRLVEAIRDRKQRQQQLEPLKGVEAQLEEMLDRASAEISKLDEWLVEGIKLWVDSFNPGQLHLRIYPFEATPNFQILANLKRDCFVDPDIEHLLFSYGTRPNVKLSVFGLVSSLPPEGGHKFDPMSEFALEGNEMGGNEHIQFELGFRQAFAGLQGLEAFGRFDRYPNVTVLPLAVFRSIKT